MVIKNQNYYGKNWNDHAVRRAGVERVSALSIPN
jgi:hypothetical protein